MNVPVSTSRRAPRARTPRSSRPILTHGEYFEDVLLRRSGRSPGEKSLTQQFCSPQRVAASQRRNAILADPWRLAFSRHPRYESPLPPMPRPRRTRMIKEEEPVTTPFSHMVPSDRMPLALRVPELRDIVCRGCLNMLRGLTAWRWNGPQFPRSQAFTLWPADPPLRKRASKEGRL